MSMKNQNVLWGTRPGKPVRLGAMDSIILAHLLGCSAPASTTKPYNFAYNLVVQVDIFGVPPEQAMLDSVTACCTSSELIVPGKDRIRILFLYFLNYLLLRI